MADIEITVSKRRDVDAFTDCGWRDLTIKCEIGELSAVVTDDGSHIEGITWSYIAEPLWEGIEQACQALQARGE